MSSFFKRAVAGFIATLTLMLFCGIRVATVATDEKLMAAGLNQSKRKVVISQRRGSILDCFGRPLTDEILESVTLVFPNEQGPMVLSELLTGDELTTALNKLKNGNAVRVNKAYKKETEGAVSIEIPKRYSGTLTTSTTGFFKSWVCRRRATQIHLIAPTTAFQGLKKE